MVSATSESGKHHQHHQVSLSQNLEDKIRSLQEVAKDFSRLEIETALKESHMDLDVAAEKLLVQDPYVEVDRRRSKKKQNGQDGSYTEPRRQREYVGQKERNYGASDNNARNVRRGSYTKSTQPGTREHRVKFHVKNDNRVNHSVEATIPVSAQASSDGRRMTNLPDRSSAGALGNQKQPGSRYVPSRNGMSGVNHKFSQSNSFSGSRKEGPEKRPAVFVTSAVSQAPKAVDSQSHSASLSATHSVGVYPSAFDPVHVPSPDSRSPAAIGSRKRDVGVVGGRRKSGENNYKQSSRPGSSNSNSVVGSSSIIGPSRPSNTSSRHEQLSYANASDSVIIGSAVSRAFMNNHHGNRVHQQPSGHLKGTMWKPKSSQKSNSSNPGVIGTPVKSALPRSDDSNNVEADSLKDKLSEININDGDNVIIAEHIRVPENDRCRVKFGSFDPDSDPSVGPEAGFHFQAIGSVETTRPSISDEPTSSNLLNSFDEQARNSASGSPSATPSGQQLADKRDTSEAPDIDNYADNLVSNNTRSFVASDSHQLQDNAELQNFQGYVPLLGYDNAYYRQTMDDAVQGQNQPSGPEVLASHNAASIPASSIMMQQQPGGLGLPQMYPHPHVHVPPYTNIMPYRQYMSPVYVPQMGLPGYSSNPSYPHPSNGNSYVLMSGGSSPHLAPNNLKYGVQQFKPVPPGAPTSFGGFPNPSGYAVNGPGVVGGANGLDDSSRFKYKDNLYVNNPQAETSEVWMPNPRDLQGMQSGPYYNMQGQTAHHAYLQSPIGHTSFNPAVAAANAQSSHMQFPGLYHPPQPAAMPNAHHLGTAMGGNIGVAPAAPGAQVGAYQPQPQLGHLNWTQNF